MLVDGVEVISLVLQFGPAVPAPRPLVDGVSAMISRPSQPLDVAVEQLEGRQGRLGFTRPPAEAQAMFPHAARYIGADRVAALACCSCVVGMVVPGLYSIFAGLELSLYAADDAEQSLEFAVTGVNTRYRLVRLAVRGAGLAGGLETSSRPPPAVQASTAAIAPSVRRDECVGATALVIGGSRGLGEVTAKLIAAGGGHVIITYMKGGGDADAVAADINGWGGHCETAAYDVRQAAAPQIARLSRAPTHLYYFATPTIFRRKSGLCALERFQEFNSFYVAGFLDAVEACLGRRPEGIDVFYPSTVYVENRPAEMTEYAMAKAAGEILCADLQKYMRGVRVLMRRLPRSATDQTGSVVPSEVADPVGVMLPVVREMHRSGVPAAVQA
jgi:hypothetical protein